MKMKLTVFAATGGIGRKLIEQAIAAGHQVTAVARNPRNLPRNIRVITVDLAAADPGAVACAVDGADAVLSGLGPRRLSEAGITSRGTQVIIQAMKTVNARRLVVISAAPIGTVPSPGRPNPPKHDPGDGFFMRRLLAPLAKAVLHKHYTDLALMEDLVRDSGLDWTIIRPPGLTNKPLTGKYRIAFGRNLHRGLFISRADAADLMLKSLERPDMIGQTIGIAY